MNTAAASSHTIELKKGQQGQGLEPHYFARRTAGDWLFAAFVIAGAAWAFLQYSAAMDGYEKAILVGAVPAMIWLGWFWRPLRVLTVVVAALALLAIWLYQTPTGADLARADQA
ncbi:MAG: c-type cytochrome biogenesis protein CcsB, partial [Burkholderiaceae bacterium]|nr:c-type cytochrome biogenesis protein CcsB [Burkholderiaceae bacterium]